MSTPKSKEIRSLVTQMVELLTSQDDARVAGVALVVSAHAFCDATGWSKEEFIQQLNQLGAAE